MDIWRTGIARAPIAEILERGGIGGLPIQWLPHDRRSFTFLADPFGLAADGKIHVFVEAFDYRERRGRIDVLTFDESLKLLDRSICLSEPWHLSYPCVFQDDPNIYMLPEAHRSGALTLYRAADFPCRWEAAFRLELPEVPVDATPFFHDGHWWLFYSPAGGGEASLHLAFSERLDGRWRAHPLNPLRNGNDGCRPAGRIVLIGGQLVLPVQDSLGTYGSSVRALTIHEITTEAFECKVGSPIGSPSSLAPYDAGLHTLSAVGELTLFDVKRIDRSLTGKLIGLVGKGRRAAAGFRRQSD